MSKTCRTCAVEKDESEFYPAGEYLLPDCKDCKRAYQREYSASPAGRARDRRARDRKRAYVEAEFVRRGEQCEDCGYPHDLVWHHRDPGEKSFRIGIAILKSFEAIKRELAKCDLLCPNCHAARHREQKAAA